MTYEEFLIHKSDSGGNHGFAPLWMPDFLFDFQASLVEWALLRGRAAIFADCGLGKSPIELVWAENVRRQTNKPTLILTPLAVGAQMVAEGEKFGIDASRSREGAVTNTNIVVTNYEKLHLFNPDDFGGVVCDESSILKHLGGATQKAVTRFMLHLPYRLLATATAAPNDYLELGTSSQALGELGHSEMLTRFFSQSEVKPCRREDVKAHFAAKQGQHFAKLAFRVSQTIDQWHLKPHAEEHFWRWVASWARACRRPSDLGFSDDMFVLPELVERDHTVIASRLADGHLFARPAIGLSEEREERRRTLQERCEYVAELVRHDRPAVVWCHLNDEGDLLESLIPGSVQVAGRDTEEKKELAAEWFVGRLCICQLKGKWDLLSTTTTNSLIDKTVCVPSVKDQQHQETEEITDSMLTTATQPNKSADSSALVVTSALGNSEMTRNALNEPQCTCGYKSGRRVLITKSKIFGLGLNWPHCAHVVTFASHSWEQHYQSVRRCWRFGQTQPVTVDIVSTEGEVGVRENMKRKSEQASKMFSALVEHMHQSTILTRIEGAQPVEVPLWLSTSK